MRDGARARATAGLRTAAAAAAIAAAPVAAADAALVYQLTGTDVVVEQPAPLFATDTVTGTLVIDDGVAPGASFGRAAILDFTLSFGGISASLADIAGDPVSQVQGFGTRSADGLALSVLDLRFDFPNTTPGCGFACAGQIVIDSPVGPNDPSNFVAIDDLGGATTSILRFTPSLALADPAAIPEPHPLLPLAAGSLLALAAAGGGPGASARARSRRRIP